MTLLIKVFFFICIFVCSVYSQNPSVLTEEGINSVLNNERWIQRQVKCAIGQGPCDTIGKRLKTLAPFVLRGQCPNCTKQEIAIVRKALSHIQKHYPKEWNAVIKAYAGASG